MRDLLRGFYQPSEEEFQRIWEFGIFILDTSVLLNIYRYPIAARNDLLNVLRNISERVWIPHHVALEYQRNRIGVIAEQEKKFADVYGLITDLVPNLEKSIHELQVRGRHSVINVDPLVESLKVNVDNFLAQMQEAKKSQLEISKDDTLRSDIDKIFEGRVGVPPSAEEIEHIAKEGSARFAHRHPPGFLDEKKSQSEETVFTYGGIGYEKRFGDLIIWKQVLKYVSEIKASDVIFLTDDRKDDWWWSVESGGKKRIGPRPELVDEIIRCAGVKSFYMYNSPKFLEYANSYFNAKIESETIAQVRTLSSQHTRRTRAKYAYSEIVSAVHQWIKDSYDLTEIARLNSVPDFIAQMDNGEKLAFEISVCNSLETVAKTIARDISILDNNDDDWDFVNIVIVETFESVMNNADLKKIRDSLGQVPDKIGVVLGKIKKDLESDTLVFENYHYIY